MVAYERNFSIPLAMVGLDLKIRFDGVYSFCNVFANGQVHTSEQTEREKKITKQREGRERKTEGKKWQIDFSFFALSISFSFPFLSLFFFVLL